MTIWAVWFYLYATSPSEATPRWHHMGWFYPPGDRSFADCKEYLKHFADDTTHHFFCGPAPG